MEPDPKKQFADSVVCFSSQYGGERSQSYGALNLAGNSYNYPSYGDFTQAFVLVGVLTQVLWMLASKLIFISPHFISFHIYCAPS